MGHKNVCLSCRLCFNLKHDAISGPERQCPQCKKPMRYLPHRFRPPKKTDLKGWQLVKFLVENGFPFQHIYTVGNNELVQSKYNNYTPYPKNLRDAKAFIEQYKMKSRKGQ